MAQRFLFQVVLLLVGLSLSSDIRVAAQQETLVYLPFGWDGPNNAPISASILAVDAAASQTTWGLYERPLDREVGPATLIQGPSPSQASLIYVAPLADGLPSQTLTGDCAIETPVAVCSMNVDIPTGRVTVRPTVTVSVTASVQADADVRETGPARNAASTRVTTPVTTVWMFALLGYGVVAARVLG
ncbi:hypothetical protein FA13DRAFT_1787203 [Coprinellus micaceus]|uniref:DUF11 domain-containing protein n=1 Tax=Coprinellus micaceus TaxID=71717 RepID=A0A4Y7TSB8_COPMI|nr:hypothetical protein FA13DRAFT_1787203 [Coprinellus micaceus]